MRLLALEVVRDIFSRSTAFRGLLTANFKQFLALTVGYQIPLPPPSRSAERLRELALALLEAWQLQYASYYPQACRSKLPLRCMRALASILASCHCHVSMYVTTNSTHNTTPRRHHAQGPQGGLVVKLLPKPQIY